MVDSQRPDREDSALNAASGKRQPFVKGMGKPGRFSVLVFPDSCSCLSVHSDQEALSRFDTLIGNERRRFQPKKRAGRIGGPGVATPPFDSNAPSAMKRSSILQAAWVRLPAALDDEDASAVATARIRFLQGPNPQ